MRAMAWPAFTVSPSSTKSFSIRPCRFGLTFTRSTASSSPAAVTTPGSSPDWASTVYGATSRPPAFCWRCQRPRPVSRAATTASSSQGRQRRQAARRVGRAIGGAGASGGEGGAPTGRRGEGAEIGSGQAAPSLAGRARWWVAESRSQAGPGRWAEPARVDSSHAQSRNRGAAQRGQIHPLQCSGGQRPGHRCQFPLLHDRAQFGRGGRARWAPAAAFGPLGLEGDHPHSGGVCGHRRPGEGRQPGRGPGQQVPGQHPRGGRHRARGALLRGR